VTDGGYVNVAVLQLRVALTERFGFIATEDGYADAHFHKVLDDGSGFANIAFGFKYALLDDPESESLLTVNQHGVSTPIGIGNILIEYKFEGSQSGA
jgi:hypothetical protein